jgi:hypothetical protein
MTLGKTTKDYSLEWKPFDGETLHAEIKAACGDKFAGISSADGELVIIHMTLDANGTDASKARQLFDAHDIEKVPPKPVRKSVEERLEEMANEIAELKAGRAIDAQSVKK